MNIFQGKAYLFNFDGNNGQELDIPLIAATIHYSKVTDFTVFDGKEGEKEDDIGMNEDNYGDSSGSTILGEIIETNQTWSFYKVANIIYNLVLLLIKIKQIDLWQSLMMLVMVAQLCQ